VTAYASFAARVREANAPRPPEGSVRLRVACVVTVAISVAAAAEEGELGWPAAGLIALLVAVGTTFSHRTREQSYTGVKLLVAVGAVAATVEFIHRLYGAVGTGITGAEGPLVFLLGSVLVVHSFHVPARRDLLFALAGSAAMVAIAAAAAVDMSFAAYALGWAAAGFWALIECGSAAGGGSPPRWAQVGTAAATAAVIAMVTFLVLPAPTANVTLDFRSDPGTAGPVPDPGKLAGDAGQPTQLSRPGRATGATRVGGYLGFAGDLDTAIRGSLGHQVVMQVRASIPTFWVGETFDRWDGQNWSSTLGRPEPLPGGSPFTVPGAPSTFSQPTVTDIQTFYIDSFTADLAFHADQADQVWFPSSYLLAGRDGSIVSPVAVGQGAIYTVESNVAQPTPAQLTATGSDLHFPSDLLQTYTSLPHSYPQVSRLVTSLTAGSSGEYRDVETLINWIGAHTRYSTDIPPLPPGTDAVDNFLFKSRVGYCEQISTALAVMLRTLGIPAREAVGYVPGPYNPVTDVYEVEADDAHAWVQVWFPGFGWVDFDPTAVVPDANPDPGTVALGDLGRFIAALPWVQIGAGAGAAAAVGVLVLVGRRRRRAGHLSPAEAAVARMEKVGRRSGRPRAPSETVVEYAGALSGGWPAVAEAVEASAYGGIEIDRRHWDRLLLSAQRVE
jgi:transglutaminase-like putative cysteine protease